MKVSKGRDVDSWEGEKGRKDEETDSTIVEAMEWKDGHGERGNDLVWKGAERRRKMGRGGSTGGGGTKRG